jgi:hypothetical protein
LDLCYNLSNERLHNAAEPGRVDDGKRARLSNSTFFGHAERTTRTFNPRCFASLRVHLRLPWLHGLFFGIVKPTFSPPAALCALAGRIKEGEIIPGWAERRANARKRARCGHGGLGAHSRIWHLAGCCRRTDGKAAQWQHMCAKLRALWGVVAAHSPPPSTRRSTDQHATHNSSGVSLSIAMNSGRTASYATAYYDVYRRGE